MSKPITKPIPDGMHTVTPHLVCAGASDAIEFYKKAFDATETSRLPAPDGKLMHATIRIGDSTLMLVDEAPQHGMLGPKSLKGSPVIIHLYVNDADAVAARAAAAGAKITMPVSEGMKKRTNSPVVWNRLGALSTGPNPPARHPGWFASGRR